ncbi:MAG: ABC transporter permease [Myxococcaceae bacterium]|nr:ABC transporter permease [Myxococcaceae bacterium]
MGTTSKLAARNLLRSPRRTLMTAISLVAGVGIFILGDGFVSGMTENVIVAAIDGTVGHVQLRPKGYPTQPGQHPIDRLVTLTPEAKALLDREAVAWTGRTVFAPLAAHGPDSVRVMAVGYEPERDVSVFPRDLWKVEGALPAPGRDEVAVAPRVARLLQLKVGDPFVLQVRTHQGAINALQVTVAGILRTGNAELDALAVLMPARLAHRLIASELPSHISVRLRHRDDAEGFAEKLRAVAGPDVEVVTWVGETANLVHIQQVRRKALNGVMFILMALAAFGVANTILMAAHERIREIGTLRSMGMTERGVLRLFVTEGALIGLAGSALGALWGGWLVSYWSRHPIDFSEIFEKAAKGTLNASALIYTHFDGRVVLASIAVGVVVAVVASLYPARVAARMVPAEAVRAP